jgi:hypothetical protein
MTICLATLVLNEMEWLPRLYQQHIDWPGLQKWIFVESADSVYASANPKMVSNDGLSVDGTTEFLEELAKNDERVVHIRQGLSTHRDPAQGKCKARQRYLNEMESIRPDYFIVLDADEFYTKSAQNEIPELMDHFPSTNAFIFRHREIWRPPSIADNPLFDLEVVGGFWGIPYCRCWRWTSHLHYRSNHNTPEKGGVSLDRKSRRMDRDENFPCFIHMGFAAGRKNREAKNAYYAVRGEAKDPMRSWYVQSRACFSTWQPGDVLPRNAQVISYTGPIPECFQ